MKFLLSVDLGSSVCKAVVYDLDFNERGRKFREIETRSPRPGWAEQDPELWWRSTAETIEGVLAKSQAVPGEILGVGVCGQCHGPVLVDEEEKALMPCIVWPDLRATKQAEALTARTRRPMHVYYTAAKLSWIQQNCEEDLKKTFKLLLPKDFIRLKLTGSYLTDPTDAEWTEMYDRSKGDWRQEILDLLGISRAQMPEIRPSKEIAGEVTEKASRETGLMEGTPVSVGAGDAYCTLLALTRGLNPRSAVVYLGTAPGIFLPSKETTPGTRSVWTTTDRVVLTGGFMGVGGASLKWLKDQLDPTGDRLSYESLDQLAEKVKPGSEGLFFLPHLMGERIPRYSPHLRGALIGLTLGHGVGHIARAMMEAVAYHLKVVAEARGETGGLTEIVVAGGGAKSRLWRTIIADVFDLPVNLPKREEVASLGASFLLSVGLSIDEDLEEARRRAKIEIVDTVHPREENVETYSLLLNLYRKLDNGYIALESRGTDSRPRSSQR